MLQVIHLAGAEPCSIVGEHQFEAFLEVISALLAPKETEHHPTPKKRRIPAKMPPLGSREI